MTTYDRPFGRAFEDFVVGDVYRHWPGKTITEYDDHLFCLLTMNHHPLHIDAWFGEHETVQRSNVVVGNLVYSLALGMSVPDVSGSAIRESRDRVAPAQVPDVPRGHDLRRDPSPRGCGVPVQGRPRHSDGRDPCLQPARERGLLLPPQGDGMETGGSPAPQPPVRGGRGLIRLRGCRRAGRRPATNLPEA